MELSTDFCKSVREDGGIHIMQFYKSIKTIWNMYTEIIDIT